MTRKQGMKQDQGSDHDLLIRIDEKLNQFITRFDEHVKENDHAYTAIGDRVNALSTRLQAVEKLVWLGIGGLAVMEIGLTIWSHLSK